MVPGAVQRLQGEDWSVELEVVLHILLVFSCFSISGVGEALFLASYGTPGMPFGVS
jgi:hypothetical protein